MSRHRSTRSTCSAHSSIPTVPAQFRAPALGASIALGLALGIPAGAAAQLDQTWFELQGGFVTTGDHWGTSVAMLPDANGDGHADVIIGSPQNVSVGSAYIISGKAPHTLIEQFFGDTVNSTFGQVVALAGFVDGDTVPACW